MTTTTTHAALDAVNELVKPHKLRIEITPFVAYTVKAPCLLRQLAGAAMMGMEGGRGVPGSRPAINLDVSDLWFDIAHNTHAWAQQVGVNRRDPGDGHAIPWVGRLLRSAAANAVSKGLDEMADRIAHDAEAWRARIEAILTGRVQQRGIRGAVCEECFSSTILEERSSPDRSFDAEATAELWRRPAIILVTHEINDQELRWLTCLACGWNVPLVDDRTELVYASVQDGAMEEAA